ncbi:class F sortase [soil metagenome]
MVLVLFVGYLLGSAGKDGSTATAQPDTQTAPGTTSGPAPVTNSAPAPTTEAPSIVPTPLEHVRPTQVEIPIIGVSSSLVDLGLNPDGTLEVPVDYSLAGWYKDGPFPGDPGDRPSSVIVGHVDSFRGPAVFYRLKELKTGDEVFVTREDGSVAVFVVYESRQFAKDAFPAEEVYQVVPDSELRLITCTGEFDSAERSYLDNFVVYAKLDPTRSGMPA